MVPNLIRAIILAALFGAAVLIGGGLLSKLGMRAGAAVKNVA